MKSMKQSFKFLVQCSNWLFARIPFITLIAAIAIIISDQPLDLFLSKGIQLSFGIQIDVKYIHTAGLAPPPPPEVPSELPEHLFPPRHQIVLDGTEILTNLALEIRTSRSCKPASSRKKQER